MTTHPKSLVSWDLYEAALSSLHFGPLTCSVKQTHGHERIWSYVLRNASFLRAIASEFEGRDVSVLDIGCADARFASILDGNSSSFSSVHYDGVDLRPKMIANARGKQFSNITAALHCADARDYLGQSDYIDVAVIAQTARYWTDDYFKDVLMLLRQKLRTGGIMCISYNRPSHYDTSDWSGYVGRLPLSRFLSMVKMHGFRECDRCYLEPDDRQLGELSQLCDMTCNAGIVKVLPPHFRALIAVNSRPDAAYSVCATFCSDCS